MWLHGVGWLLPVAVEVAMLYVVRSGTRPLGFFLEPCPEPPISLCPQRRFQHVLFTGPPARMGRPACPTSIAQRHHPPTGVQLWPGHSLYLQLRLPWKCHYQPQAAHWPRDWSAHLRTWHLYPCNQQRFQWRASAWLLACPVVFRPVHVEYSARSGHAVWTFELKER